MDLVWLVYAISLLHGFGTMFVIFTIVSSVSLLALVVYRGAECSQASYYDEAENEHRAKMAEWAMKHAKTALIVFLTSTTILTFLPSEKTAYMMVGAYAAQKIAENDKVQETGGKVMNIINQKLDEYVEEGIKDATNKAERAIRNSK